MSRKVKRTPEEAVQWAKTIVKLQQGILRDAREGLAEAKQELADARERLRLSRTPPEIVP